MGGRLGLLLGVLFHSCHLRRQQTDIMFLDFAFLTRWVYGDPLTVHL